MEVGRRVNLRDVERQYDEIAAKFLLEPKDVEYIFYQSLYEYYRTTDVMIESDGIRVDGKYRNIKYEHFNRIIKIFNTMCNARSFAKKESYVLDLLATNGNVLYGKIIDKTPYGYTFQLMLSKTAEVRYVAPITIEREGEDIPDFISHLPIEVYPSSIKRKANENLFSFNAKILTVKTIRVHLARIAKKLEREYKAHPLIKLKTFDIENRVVYLVNTGTKKQLHYAIIKHYMKYFGMFGAKTIIKTDIIRK